MQFSSCVHGTRGAVLAVENLLNCGATASIYGLRKSHLKGLRQANDQMKVAQGHKTALFATQISLLLVSCSNKVSVLYCFRDRGLLQIFMAALWNRADDYIFVLWFISIFFPRLFSAVGDWMSTILPHMVWP